MWHFTWITLLRINLCLVPQVLLRLIWCVCGMLHTSGSWAGLLLGTGLPWHITGQCCAMWVYVNVCMYCGSCSLLLFEKLLFVVTSHDEMWIKPALLSVLCVIVVALSGVQYFPECIHIYIYIYIYMLYAKLAFLLFFFCLACCLEYIELDG
jgi:hypothetical protein